PEDPGVDRSYLLRSGSDDATLRNALSARCFQNQSEEPQHRVVTHPTSDFLEHDVMSHRVEIRSQVEVDDVGLALNDRLRDALDRRVRGPLRPVAVGPRLEVSFEDRFQDEFERTLDHPIADGRNRKLAHLAAVFRDADFPRSSGSIPSLYQLLTKLIEKRVHAVCFDGVERHPIDTGGAVVLLRQLVGRTERFPFTDVTIQTPKSPRWV